MRKPITSPAAVAAGMAEPRPETKAFDRTGVLAVEPQALGFLFAEMAPEPDEDFERCGDLAVVEIEGPLAQSDDWWFDSYEAIRKRCDKAFDDTASKTVCLKINSPGGDVAGLFELCDHLKTRAANKPLVSYCDGTACSAAYAIACCAETVYAPETGRLGSIGVITSLRSMTGMAEMMGMRAAVIASGARKSDGHPMVPITDDAIKAAQKSVDDMAAVFFDHVAACRQVKPSAVAALDAAVLMGSAAKTAGLCDQVVGCFDDVLQKHGGGAEPMGSGTTGTHAASGMSLAHAKLENLPTDGQSAARGSPAGKKRNAMRDALVLALGLKAEAEEVDVMGAVTALQNDRREVLGLTGKPSMAEALGTIQGWRVGAEKLPTVEARVAELEARDVERERDALITTNERKISPAMLPWAKSQSLEALRAFVAVAPDLVASAATLPREPEVKTSKLTPAQRKAAAAAGVTEEAFAAELERCGGVE